MITFLLIVIAIALVFGKNAAGQFLGCVGMIIIVGLALLVLGAAWYG